MTKTTFDWNIYRDNIKGGGVPWLPERTLFLTRHGSHAYGTNLPTSDEDFRGIAVAPINCYLGILGGFEQAELKQPVDLTVFDLRKFVKLALDANPNALEILFTDPSDHLISLPSMKFLLDARPDFLSQKAKHTFSGYALAQMKRINTHYRWLKNPPSGAPTRAEFGLPERTVIPSDQLQAAQSNIQKQLDRWSWHEMEGIDPAMRQALKDEFLRRLLEITQWGEDAIEEKTWVAASRVVGYDTNFIELLDMERRYTGRLNEWRNYQNWLNTRNVARAELEAKWGYDCYLDDTEFLTEAGWKRYDEITESDLLGTLNQATGQIEYQHYTDRVEKPYSGLMGVLEPRHSNCAVTLNHRMWLSPAHRSSKNGFSWGYNQEGAEWGIQSLQSVLAGKRSYFHVRLAGEAKVEAFNVDPDFLVLMGAYVSEGCVGKRLSDGTPSVLRITQKVGGRICQWMDDLAGAYPRTIHRYEVLHDEESRTEPCLEHVWTVADRDWATRLEAECGSGALDKRLPTWTRQLNRAQACRLLQVMLAGDGTPHGDGWVYYTASKRLADDVQTMCVSTGIVSAVWGPYPNDKNSEMYQVFVKENVTPFSTVVLREDGSQSFTVTEVNAARIVCFTVPNEVLVTRRKGRVAIQGNTKHAMHLVRLTRMCREVLIEGEVRVKRPDAAELLEIRHGAWTYEQLVAYTSAQDAELNALLLTTKLPKMPNQKKLDTICTQMILEMV